MDKDKLDRVVMDVLRFHRKVGDAGLRAILMREFPDEPTINMWAGAWNYPPVERSLHRLHKRGLVTARRDHRDCLVDWRAVNPLDALTNI